MDSRGDNDLIYNFNIHLLMFFWQNVGTEADPKWQWDCVDTEGNVHCGFMLNTDVEMLYELDLDANGKSSCDFTTCAESPTHDQVQNYNEVGQRH